MAQVIGVMQEKGGTMKMPFLTAIARLMAKVSIGLDDDAGAKRLKKISAPPGS